MDKNYIVELIKANRLQEAINLLEKASVGTDIHNDLILLASSYSEYAKLNRTATQDAQELDIKRNKITTSILQYLEDIKDEDLEKVAVPKKPAPKYVETFTTDIPDKSANNKLYMYGGIGAVVLVLLIIIINSGGSSNTQTSNDNTSAANMANSSNQNSSTFDINNVKTVHFTGENGIEGSFYLYNNHWYEKIENSSDPETGYNFDSAEGTSIHLSNNKEGINIELDLANMSVKSIDDQGKSTIIYTITEYK